MINLEFLQLPVSEITKISDKSIKVYALIYTQCMMNNNLWYHTESDIANELGLDIQKVKRAIKELSKGNFINYEIGSNLKNKSNVYRIPSIGIKSDTYNNESIKSDTNIGIKSDTNISIKNDTLIRNNKKENIDNNIVNSIYNSSICRKEIKEKKESNEIINGKLNRKDEVKEEHNDNNIIFNKERMNMKLNSQSAVQSEDWTKQQQKEKTNSSSTGTMKIVQFGDNTEAIRYLVEDKFDDSSILASIPSVSPSSEKKRIQQITPSTSVQTNPTEQLSNEDETIAPDTLKTANTDNNGCDSSMDCGYISIDDLENMYNGGQQIVQSKPISSAPKQTTTSNNSSYNGGGRKFTPKNEWDNQMKNIDVKTTNLMKLTKNDWDTLVEGANDKYRVIETLKAIEKMLKNYVKLNGYGLLINACGDTLEDNKETYSEKQYKFAWEMYDRCADQFEIFVRAYPKLNK